MSHNDRMHDADLYLYPSQRVSEGSTFLWYPWCVYAMRMLSHDRDLPEEDRRGAEKCLKNLRARAGDFQECMKDEYNYAAAEALVGFDWPADIPIQRIQ